MKKKRTDHNRSGPNISRDQRHKRGVELTLSPEALELQDDIMAVTNETRTALVERLTLTANVPTRQQWAKHLERQARKAARAAE